MLSATAWENDALFLKQKPAPQQWETMPTIRAEEAVICHRVSTTPTHVGPVMNVSKKKKKRAKILNSTLVWVSVVTQNI
jgi:hypothetical protein